MRATLIIFSILLGSPIMAAEAKAPTSRTYPAQIGCLDELVRMSECQLLDLYRRAEPGVLPPGFAPGRVISKPGRFTTVPVSKFAKATYWQGKYFDENGIMTNRMFGVRFIKGAVGQGESLIDGKPSNIIDYRGTSLLFRSYRDELREVSPGIFLGAMIKVNTCKSKVATYFAIDVTQCRGIDATAGSGAVGAPPPLNPPATPAPKEVKGAVRAVAIGSN